MHILSGHRSFLFVPRGPPGLRDLYTTFPLQVRLTSPQNSRRPRFLVLLLRFLLFRVMFTSGWVKLASGDPTWKDHSALLYYYETQPLPTWIGWYVHQLPQGFQEYCVIAVFIIQLVVPFLIFGPGRVRYAAATISTEQRRCAYRLSRR